MSTRRKEQVRWQLKSSVLTIHINPESLLFLLYLQLSIKSLYFKANLWGGSRRTIQQPSCQAIAVERLPYLYINYFQMSQATTGENHYLFIMQPPIEALSTKLRWSSSKYTSSAWPSTVDHITHPSHPSKFIELGCSQSLCEQIFDLRPVRQNLCAILIRTCYKHKEMNSAISRLRWKTAVRAIRICKLSSGELLILGFHAGALPSGRPLWSDQ